MRLEVSAYFIQLLLTVWISVHLMENLPFNSNNLCNIFIGKSNIGIQMWWYVKFVWVPFRLFHLEHFHILSVFRFFLIFHIPLWFFSFIPWKAIQNRKRMKILRKIIIIIIWLNDFVYDFQSFPTFLVVFLK